MTISTGMIATILGCNFHPAISGVFLFLPSIIYSLSTIFRATVSSIPKKLTSMITACSLVNSPLAILAIMSTAAVTCAPRSMPTLPPSLHHYYYLMAAIV
jgi:hypothetical protein